MYLYLATDHRGFASKEAMRELLTTRSGYRLTDCSPSLVPGDDYPAVARSFVEAFRVGDRSGPAAGIVWCGSGAGIAIALNRCMGIRAVQGQSPEAVVAARRDDDVNVLVIAADFVSMPDAIAMVDAFLLTPFVTTESHVRRVAELEALA